MQLTPIMYGFFAAMIITLTACDKPQPPAENTSLSTPKAEQIVALAGETMGSTYHIKYLEKNNFPASPKQVHEDIEKILVDVNAKMSTYIKTSELSQFNQNTQTQTPK